MKKISEVLGMRIVDEEGNIIGEAEKVIYSRSNGRVVGIIFRTGRILKGEAAVLFKDIQSIGRDAIIIKKGRSAVADPMRIVGIANVLEKEQDIMGYPVFTADGTELGEIKDIVFDEVRGDIRGYMLAGGLFEDIMEGRRILNYSDKITVGDGAVIVDDHRLDTFSHSQDSGLKNILKLED